MNADSYICSIIGAIIGSFDTCLTATTPKRAASGSELANQRARSSHEDENEEDGDDDDEETEEEEEKEVEADDVDNADDDDDTPARRVAAVVGGGANSTLPASRASGSVSGTRKRASWCGAVESSARLTAMCRCRE